MLCACQQLHAVSGTWIRRYPSFGKPTRSTQIETGIQRQADAYPRFLNHLMLAEMVRNQDSLAGR